MGYQPEDNEGAAREGGSPLPPVLFLTAITLITVEVITDPLLGGVMAACLGIFTVGSMVPWAALIPLSVYRFIAPGWYARQEAEAREEHRLKLIERDYKWLIETDLGEKLNDDCRDCGGKGYIRYPFIRVDNGSDFNHEMVCPQCSGLGWDVSVYPCAYAAGIPHKRLRRRAPTYL